MLSAVFGFSSPQSAKEIPLVSFAADASPSLTHTWTALNDPVMGGKSHSTVSVSDGVLKFVGTCAIVPSLGAPGFITAQTGDPSQDLDQE